VYNAGHEIGLHTWSHQHSTSLTNDQIIAELVWCAKAIYSAIGVVPRFFRLPYGDIDDRVRAVVKALDLIPVMWNYDTADAGLAQANIPTVVSKAKQWLTQPTPNGIMSLEHDLFQYSSLAAQSVVDVAKASKYTLVKMRYLATF
jgi:peptidoglycan/xylan/chitin deacetylase (PgdA/CDA1 family)